MTAYPVLSSYVSNEYFIDLTKIREWNSFAKLCVQRILNWFYINQRIEQFCQVMCPANTLLILHKSENRDQGRKITTDLYFLSIAIQIEGVALEHIDILLSRRFATFSIITYCSYILMPYRYLDYILFEFIEG